MKKRVSGTRFSCLAFFRQIVRNVDNFRKSSSISSVARLIYNSIFLSLMISLQTSWSGRP